MRLEDVGGGHHAREHRESELQAGGYAVADRRGDEEGGSGSLSGAGLVGGQDGTGAEGCVRAQCGTGPGYDVERVTSAEGDLDEGDAFLDEGEHGGQRGVRIAAADDGEQPVGAQRREQVHRGSLLVVGVRRDGWR